jgi:ribonuclease III
VCNRADAAVRCDLKSQDLTRFQADIGYQFRNAELLLRSLTHTSRVREPGGEDERSNEQMEFLGDSILGFLVAEALVQRFPGYSEGQLSKLKAFLVSSSHLYETAQRFELGKFLRLGKGEEHSGGRGKKALQADAVEALLAAIYLDGGMQPVRDFVSRWILDSVNRTLPAEDYKSALQELLQGWHGPQPRYVVIEERGPEHSKTFKVQVRVGSERLAEAEGETKKAAQQAAAQIALTKLRERPLEPEDGKAD